MVDNYENYKLGLGVKGLNWQSFIEIREIACSATAWCSWGYTLYS